MVDPSDVTVRYWGTTGSFARIPTADELQRLVARTIIALRSNGDLDDPNMTLEALEPRITAALSRFRPSQVGGNTTCLELRIGESTFLVDAGTGLQAWGAHNDRDVSVVEKTRSGHLFMTHAHLDHTCALPFVDAFYDDRNAFTIWAAPHVLDQLKTLMGSDAKLQNALFPTSFDMLPGIRALQEFEIGCEFIVDGTRICTHSLNHPGGSVALRFDHGEHRVVVATDHEHSTVPDLGLAAFAANADLLYLDAQYTQDEYDGRRAVGATVLAQSRVGWGHSTIESCVQTAISANAHRLHLGHHDPRRTSDELASMEAHAQQCMRHHGNRVCRVNMAMEGEEWKIGSTGSESSRA